MRFPPPQPGLVIRYAYLWRRESDQGRDEGAKDRPCAIILSILTEQEKTEAVVLPITHAPPSSAADAVEIPYAVGRRLGLDDARAWIVIAETNVFVWPGPDLRPVPGEAAATSVAYGFLPPEFFAHVKAKFLERIHHRKMAAVRRTE